MKIVSAHNWDPAFIPVARRFGVFELFAKLDADAVGGGRPSIIVPPVRRGEAARQIRSILDAGIRFNYLLNSMGAGKHEITRAWRRRLHALLAWIHDSGVRVVTVGTPYIGAIVRERHPDIELVVSMFGGVTSVEQAAKWQALGASAVILYESKDFSLIRGIAEHTDLEVEVTANLWCMPSCHQRHHHAVMDTVSSHEHAPYGEYSLPLCETRCSYEKYAEPRRILAASWMRPEDVGFYEAQGVSRLKVLDRSSTTAYLQRVLEAYTTRGYDGNLADLIFGFNRERYVPRRDVRHYARVARAFLRPTLIDITRARAFQQRSKPPKMEIRGDALDGFVEGLAARDCRLLACDECRWCDDWAARAVRFDEGARAAYLDGMRENLVALDSGRLFGKD